MLVITRKAGQSVRIGKDVKVRIVEVNKGQVKIGIEAPMSTLILRNELEDRKKSNG